MTDLAIVPTLPSHLDAILEIEKQCFSTPWSKNSFASGLTAPNLQSCFTALHGDRIAGYVCIFHLFEEGEILNVAVSPTFRRSGIGQALLDRAFTCLKEKGAERVTLVVRKSNEAAKNLYLKNGFSPIAVRKNYYSAPTEDGIVMEKHL